MRIVTAAEMREIDRVAIEELGVPGLLLMEHAASAVVAAVEDVLAPGGRVVVVAGGGNNGGDGYAVARLLRIGGIDARVVAVVPPERLRGDAATMCGVFRRLGGEVVPPAQERGSLGVAIRAGDVIVDALFGTGLSRAPDGEFEQAIEAIDAGRNLGARVVAVDLPSGLDADRCLPEGACVEADVTVTFGFLKPGLVLEPGARFAGEVRVADIALPKEASARPGPRFEWLEEASVRAHVPARRPDTHKGTFGHVLLVAGSLGKTGAAALGARAVLVGGAGLVTVAARPDAMAQAIAHVPEAMGLPLPGTGALGPSELPVLLEALEQRSALAIGPGIPRGPETGALLAALLPALRCPAVLDADALNALEGQTAVLRSRSAPVVITPHPGEMARLLGVATAAVQADRPGLARRFAVEHGVFVVLKGSGTLIASPDGALALCPTGNPGMATAGAGDVLTGLLAALLAQGLPVEQAARVAVYAHGLAGDRCAAVRGRMGLTASDLLDVLPEVWASWER